MSDSPNAATASEAGRRPLLRGYLHLFAAFVAVAGCVVLMLLADSPRAYVGGAVFAASLILLYFTSGVYHTITWGRRARAALQRLDHSMIFVLIAGTYTPFCLLVARDAWGIALLSVIWSVAGAGILLKLAWGSAPRWLNALLYVSAGWIAVVAATELADWFAAVPLALLLSGGILYTLGALVYAAGKPNPFPRVFGYHEVFHVMVTAGSALHYSLVAIYVIPA